MGTTSTIRARQCRANLRSQEACPSVCRSTDSGFGLCADHTAPWRGFVLQRAQRLAWTNECPLKLAHNFITDYGVYKLSRFENKITNLDLNENPMNSINVTHFTSRVFHHVQVLNMGGARLFNDSLTTLTRCSRMGIAFMNISRLYMDNCDFTDPRPFAPP